MSSIIITVATLLIVTAILLSFSKPPTKQRSSPQGRFTYFPGKYRRRKLAEFRRNYPGQSEDWHQRSVDEFFKRKGL